MRRVKDSLTLMLAMMLLMLAGIELKSQQQTATPEEVFAYYSMQDRSMYLEWIIRGDYDEIESFYATISQITEDGTIIEMPGIKIDAKDPMLKMYLEKGFAYYGFYYPNYELRNGTYVLNMVAYSKYGESAPSADSYFIVEDGNNEYALYISEYPEMTATVGKKFSSKIKAERIDGEPVTVNYSIQKGPEGMTIGKESGLIEFTPQASGYVDYWITAVNAENAEEFVDFYGFIQVLECENPGIIKGGITYSDKLEKKAGMVHAYKFDANGNMIYGASSDVFETGDFELSVDKGTYYLYFVTYDQVDDYIDMGEWYKDAVNIEQATTIEVNCGQTVQVEWTVGESSSYTKYEVKGSVKMEDGTPLAYSTVIFESAIEADSINVRYYTKATSTDENGNYSILLPDLFKYRAFCYAGTENKPGNYRPKYWDNTFNPLEATIIELKSDISGINFVFKKEDFEIPDGSISGKVLNTSNVPIESAFVIAFKVKSLDGKDYEDLYQGYAAITDENGAYKFDYMNYGEYVLFAFPNDMNYAPGFYREDDIAALTWEDASVILHDGFNPTKERNIVLPLMDIAYGSGKIEGIVTSHGGGIKNEERGTEISGASIFLVNQQGVTNKYNKSANNGEYKLNSVAPGRYEFIVDKVGYRTHREFVEVGEDGVISGHNIELIPENVTSVDDIITSEGVSLYPNPAADNINVSFAADAGNSLIEVYDILGSKLYSTDMNTVSGDNLKNISLESLPAGQYIVKIYNGKSVKFSRFVINK